MKTGDVTPNGLRMFFFILGHGRSLAGEVFAEATALKILALLTKKRISILKRENK